MMLTLSLVAVLLYGMKSSGHEVVCHDVCVHVQYPCITNLSQSYSRRRALLLEQHWPSALVIGLECQVCCSL